MLHAVGAVFLLLTFGESDPFRIGAPLGARATGAYGFRCQLFLSRTGFCVSDIKLCCRITIGIVRVVAHESDACPVRRPRWRTLVPFAFCKPLEFLCCNIEKINVAMTPAEQVALSVL